MPCKGYYGILRLSVWAKKIWIRNEWTRIFSKTESFKTSRYVQTKPKQKGTQIACVEPPPPFWEEEAPIFSEGRGRLYTGEQTNRLKWGGGKGKVSFLNDYIFIS